jgi:flagellar export protein FliJ
MKKETFRLSNVLRYYELQKQRAEIELQQATRVLRDIEAEIASRVAEIAAVSSLLHGAAAGRLTTNGWLACYRNAEHLDRLLSAARAQRQRQAELTAKLEEQRKHWAVAEETLLSLRKAVDEHNKAEAAKDEQVVLDESVLRRWLDIDPQQALNS